MSGFTVVEAEFCSLFTETLAFGLYLTSFGFCAKVLLTINSRWRHFDELNIPMVAVAFAMFVNACFDIALAMYMNWRAHILYQGPGGPEFILEDISHWTELARSVTTLTQTIFADGILIYRCWVTYNRSFRAVTFSVLLWLGNGVCAFFLIFYQANIRNPAIESASKLFPFGVAFWAVTVALNVVTTSLLIWPIWKSARENEQFLSHSTGSKSPNTLRSAMVIIIESALLYTMLSFIVFVTYTTGNNAFYIAAEMNIQVSGIAFNLIIIRTAYRNKISQRKDTNAQSVSLHFIAPRATGITSMTEGPTEYDKTMDNGVLERSVFGSTL
ncbi:hypothetical protein BDQ12DRAFT_670097 [Crucibulum laeve]|uniref:G-protein coupled receptors family 1 profile domain-containing protein n=1 Tax=Crucibulum laeve TaxID=68775 RepID=A0A5C3LLF3_9AGAR|nr:hypothetical protein BDQ12DRAFT_670097 [Crucibulum laeve]